eukprot:scaffold48348_cov21-Tisochrysis_lutea.AAC.2
MADPVSADRPMNSQHLPSLSDPTCHNGLPHYHALVLTQAQAHVVALRLRWCAAFAHGIAVPTQYCRMLTGNFKSMHRHMH